MVSANHGRGPPMVPQAFPSQEIEVKILKFPVIAFLVLAAVALSSIPAAEAAARQPCRNESCGHPDPENPFIFGCIQGGTHNCDVRAFGLACTLTEC